MFLHLEIFKSSGKIRLELKFNRRIGVLYPSAFDVILRSVKLNLGSYDVIPRHESHSDVLRVKPDQTHHGFICSQSNKAALSKE